MAQPKLLVEIDGEAGGLFSILAKVAERLESFQQGSSTSAEAARKSMGALEQGAKAAAQALKIAEEELAAIKAKLASGGGSGPDPAAAVARLQRAQAAQLQISAQLQAAQQTLGQQSAIAFQRAGLAADASSRSIQNHTQAVERAEHAHESMSGSVFRAGAALMALRAALEGARQVLGSVLDSNLALERAQRTLQMATGDGAGAMAFVRRTAKELGLELVQTADGYAMMAAAAKGTSMEGKDTEQVFRSVARASAAMSLSGESTHGVILALSQMMSKGKVMAEELRKQLGEHLPGAFNIAARAMGVTTAQLDEMLRNGKVISSDFLPKFAQELELAMGDAPEKAAQSLQANINRIKTAFQGLSYEIGQGGAGDSLSRALGDIAQAMNSPEGLAAAREMSRGLGDVIIAAKDLALVLWKVREPVVALGLAWLSIKALQIVQGLYEWGAAKVAVVQQTLAARQALIQEALATESLTLAKGQNAQAEVARALAMVASRKATLENAVATGALSLAEAEAARESIRLAEAKLAEAAAMAASGRAAGVGAGAMAAMGGPLGLLIAGVGGLVFVLSQLETASHKAAKAEGDRLALAAQNRQASQGLVEDADRLNKVLESETATVDQKRRAQDQLQTVIKQLLVLYPEMAGHLQKEGDLYRWNSESTKEHTQRKLEDAKATVALAESTIKAAEAEIALMKARSEALVARNPEAGLAAVGLDLAVKSQEERLKLLQDNNRKALAEVQNWQKQLDDLLSRKDKLGTTLDKPEFSETGIITALEIQARLAAIRASSEERSTLEQQKQLALEKAKAEYLREAAEIEKQAREGKFDGNQAGVDALWEANLQRRKDREAAIEREFATKRERMEEDLQAKLTAQEEGGLEKRLEAIRKQFVVIREENAKLAKSGQAPISEDAIKAAEDAARARARIDQIRQELGKLKTELSELAQIKGGPLTSGEMAEAMERFAKKSDSAREAVAKLSQELHLNGTAAQGWSTGLKRYLADGENSFQNWENRALTVTRGVENAFAQGVQGVLSGQMTLSKGINAIWKGIVQTVIQAVAQLIAQWIVAVAVKKALGIEEAATDGGRTAAALTTASAETWEAYAGIPFVGPALALAQIALMYGSMGASIAASEGVGASVAATARKTGGVVGMNGPELTVLGDGDELEVVAPKSNFMHFASSLLSMGANLGANLSASDAQVLGYGRQAAGYAATRAAAGGSGGTIIHYHQNAPIWDPSQRGLRGMGESVVDAVRASNYERSVVLRPGLLGAI